MYYILIEFNKNGYDLTDIFNIIMITDKKDIILDTLKDYITKILFDNDKLTFKKANITTITLLVMTYTKKIFIKKVS